MGLLVGCVLLVGSVSKDPQRPLHAPQGRLPTRLVAHQSWSAILVLQASFVRGLLSPPLQAPVLLATTVQVVLPAPFNSSALRAPSANLEQQSPVPVPLGSMLLPLPAPSVTRAPRASSALPRRL